MPILTEQAAIAKVNQIIGQAGLGPEYRVYQVQASRFGWVMYWTPPGKDKELTYSSPYLVNRNGIVKEWNDVANRYRINPRDSKSVLNAFVRETETSLRN